MGILDDYNVDLDDYDTSTFDVPDGVFDFTIGEVATQDGSKNRPDQPMLYIHYILTSEDGKNYTRREYYDIPGDPSSPTDREKRDMGRLKSRIISLGFDEAEVNKVEPDELVGISGTLQLVTTKGFQGIRNLRVDEDSEPEPTPAPKPVRRAKPADKPASKPEPKAEPEPEFAELPEEQPAESDADIKARIEARRAARRAAAGAR